jgi:hypothetical protein
MSQKSSDPQAISFVSQPLKRDSLHRLEAAKALGEETIAAFLVDARKH